MYATITQYVTKYGITELAELLEDEEQLLTEDILKAAIAGDTSEYTAEEQAAASAALDRVNSALSDESLTMDSHIGARFTLPLTDPTQAPLVSCCLALTRCALADDGDNISTTMKEDRSHWRGWLNKIAKGDATLPGEEIKGMAGADHQRKTGCMPSGIDWGGY